MQKRAKVKKKAKLSFHFYYGMIIIALVGLLLAEDLLSRFDYVDIPDIFLQITAVVLGATIAAWLTTTTYDYISKSTQEREWSRSIHLKTWEEIYLPIFEEVVSYAERVEKYSRAESKVWTLSDFTPKETILGIINADYLGHVRRHKKLLSRYNEALYNFDSAMYDLSESYHTRLFPGKDVSQLTGILRVERLYLAGIRAAMTDSNRRRYADLHDAHRDSSPQVVGRPDLLEDSEETIDYLRSRVMNLAETKELRSAQSALKEDIKTLIALTEEAIRKPYEIVGEDE
ncbi:MAG: hypothetical protein LN417_04375 [Candidatus Thermoplasmatota archaeon]|nr:hypothetical protein [Candidatus Thermoplasmatota archaeon]